MAISVKTIKEKCCDDSLSNFTLIDGDSLDCVHSTCDKIIECSYKYILVEEKSILFSFLNNCCIESSINLDTLYKYTECGIEYINITDVINNVVHPMNIEVKKRIFSDTVTNLISTSGKKASNTTHLLATNFDITKTKDMQVFYLYCKSGKPIDRIIHEYLLRFKKLKFIECQVLKQILEQECA